MKVRYSENNEVSVEGSRKELQILRQAILEYLSSETGKLTIELDDKFDPTPYESSANSINFNSSVENKVEIQNSSLTFWGTEEFFRNISANLPFDAENVPYHIHYDYISFPQFLSEKSPEIVFEATE